jgi:hypothetical protein
VSPGELISFFGSGTDPEDGEISGASIEWFSSVDGALGTGSSIQATLSGPPAGEEGQVDHIITLRVTDSNGNQDTDEFLVTVIIVL